MKIGIFGAGAFGMAISSILLDNNMDVTIWTKDADDKDKLINNGYSDLFPDYKFGNSVKITTDEKECASNKDLLIIVIPVIGIRSLCNKIKDYINNNTVICIASKGIEQDTGLFPYEIVGDILNTNNIGIISGPSFAKDVIAKKPIGLSLASYSSRVPSVIYKAFANDYIKLRTNHDIIGTEICGAIKNVIAIAAGLLDGLGAGDSTRAMLITEAVHDIEELIEALDGNKRTVLSFAGFGDLLLTCTSTNSRNYSFGRLVGIGNKEDINNYLKNHTVEGYYTLKSIYTLLKDKQVKIPIIDLIYNIFYKDLDPNSILDFLIKKD